jgi:hypothetical protein
VANALLLALTKGKGKGPVESSDAMDSEASPSDDAGKDYKQLAKDAAKDGDLDGMIDALCDYFESDKD